MAAYPRTLSIIKGKGLDIAMSHSEPLPWIQPAPPPGGDQVADHFLAHEFYREVENRQAFTAYCGWYQDTAARNLRDLHQMRKEPNFFQWFRGKG
jgi:hypothetical protein